MCDARLPTTPRPRWIGLYLRLLAAAAGGLVVATWPLGAALRMTLGAVVTLAAAGMALRWLRANAAALDQATWCACAGRQTRVRVVTSAPRRRRRRRQRRGATLAG
jgi:hypothetical protein